MHVDVWCYVGLEGTPNRCVPCTSPNGPILLERAQTAIVLRQNNGPTLLNNLCSHSVGSKDAL